MKPDLKTTYTSDAQHLMKGETLNQMAAAINALHNGRGQPGIDITSKIDSYTHPFIFGVGVIVGADNECGYDQDEDAYDAPCAFVNKYVVRFRYFDEDLGIYRQNDANLRFDASIYYEPTDTLASMPSSGPGYGAIPVYSYGDVICGWYDPQRNWFHPVSVPPVDPPMAEFAIRKEINTPIATNNDAEPGLVDVYLEVFRSRGLDNDWRAISCLGFNIDTPKDQYQSRSTFATVIMPAGSGIRVRSVRGPSPNGAQIYRGITNSAISKDASVSNGVSRYNVGTTTDSGTDDTVQNHYGNISSGKRVAYIEQGPITVKVYDATLRVTGFGRRTSNYIGGTRIDAYPGGTVIGGWQGHAVTTGRYKDSPGFGLLNTYQIGVDYLDPLDQWMIDIQLAVTLRITAPSNNKYAISAECP